MRATLRTRSPVAASTMIMFLLPASLSRRRQGRDTRTASAGCGHLNRAPGDGRDGCPTAAGPRRKESPRPRRRPRKQTMRRQNGQRRRAWHGIPRSPYQDQPTPAHLTPAEARCHPGLPRRRFFKCGYPSDAEPLGTPRGPRTSVRYTGLVAFAEQPAVSGYPMAFAPIAFAPIP